MTKSYSENKRIAVVLGLSETGLAIGRLLGRNKIVVIGIDTTKNVPGAYSKYIKAIIISGKNREKRIKDTLIDRGKKERKKPVLFFDRDEYLDIIDKNRTILGNYYKILIPSQKNVKILNNKYFLYKVCVKNKIKCPLTIFLDNRKNSTTNHKKINYPCIIKPLYSRDKKKLKYKAKIIKNHNELEKEISYADQNKVKIITQEMIPGEDHDQYSLTGYINNKNQIISFCTQKIMQDPEKTGIGVLVIQKDNKEIEKIGIQLLKKINYRGFFEIEFKRDIRDFEHKLIEVNTRPWLQIELAAKYSLNLPYMVFCELNDIIFKPKEAYNNGTRWMYGEIILTTLMKNLNLRKVWKTIKILELKSLKKQKYCFAIFSMDDLKPFFLFSIRNKLKNIKRKWSKRKECNNDIIKI